jgi:hypothetical protein
LAGPVRMDLGSPAGQGFMSTQRRETRSTPATKICRRGPRDGWQRSSCTECRVPIRSFSPDGVRCGRKSGEANPARAALPVRGNNAKGRTAPPSAFDWFAIVWLALVWFLPSDEDQSLGALERLATHSLQSDHRFVRRVHSVRLFRPGIGRGASFRTAAGTPASPRSSISRIPFPSDLSRLHLALPQFPAGFGRWTERYDGKRDLHLQHAA